MHVHVGVCAYTVRSEARPLARAHEERVALVSQCAVALAHVHGRFEEQRQGLVVMRLPKLARVRDDAHHPDFDGPLWGSM